MQLESKAALITGGGTGIGAATARRFAAEGAGVVLLGPEPEPLQEVADEIEGIAVVGDAAEPADAKRAVQLATERLGGLDIVVACAGGEGFGKVLDLDDATWDRHIRLNLTTAFVTVREALPPMLARGGGAIVVVSSVAGLTAGGGIGTYTTAKTALLGFVRSLAVDYGAQGIRANAVCPGGTRTRMFEPLIAAYADKLGVPLDEAETRLNRVVPLRRIADPAEIASVCLFLASDESSFVTGSAIVADGGQSAVNVGVLPMWAD